MTFARIKQYAFCVVCQLRQPIVRRTCEECNRLVRHTGRHIKIKGAKYY